MQQTVKILSPAQGNPHVWCVTDIIVIPCHYFVISTLNTNVEHNFHHHKTPGDVVQCFALGSDYC